MGVLSDRLQQPDLLNTSDDYAAEVLNAKDETLPWVETAIPIREVLYWLMSWGVYAQLQFLARRGEGVAAELAIKVLANIEPATAPFPTLDITKPAIMQLFQTMGSSLVQAAILSQEQYDFLWNLRMQPQSWAEVNLGRSVSSTDVGRAR